MPISTSIKLCKTLSDTYTFLLFSFSNQLFTQETEEKYGAEDTVNYRMSFTIVF